MELQDVLSKLTEEEKAAISSAIDAEKSRGIEANRKKNAENLKLQTEIARFKDAIKDTLDVDEIPSDVDFKEFLAGKVKATGSKEKETELTKLRKEMDRINRKLSEEEKAKGELQRELNNKTIHQTLSTVMKDSFHGYDLLIKDLISSGKVKSVNGDVFFLDGESEIDVAAGLDKLKAQRPDLVRNTQAAGGGSAGGKTNGTTKTMTLDAFNALPGKARAEYMASGGKLT